MLVTSNLAFGEWTKVSGGDEKLTTALLDRLAHHATVIVTKGKSFSHAQKAERRTDPQRNPTGHLAHAQKEVIRNPPGGSILKR